MGWFQGELHSLLIRSVEQGLGASDFLGELLLVALQLTKAGRSDVRVTGINS
jgi:hypothetical protein